MSELARRVGTSPSQINKLEKGGVRLTVEWMERLARAIECRPVELMIDAPRAATHINTELLHYARRVAQAVLGGDRLPERDIIEVEIIAAVYDVLVEIVAERGRIDEDTIDTLIRTHRRGMGSRNPP